jgi:hypothetical protein
VMIHGDISLDTKTKRKKCSKGNLKNESVEKLTILHLMLLVTHNKCIIE